MMYGRWSDDYEKLHFPEEDPWTGTGEMIKRWDIFGRTEHMFWKDQSGDIIKIPRQFLEVVYTAYEHVAYLAFKKHGVWGESGYKGGDKELFISDLKDAVQAVLDKPAKKGDFENYSESMALTMLGMGECFLEVMEVASPGDKKARQEVSKIINGIKDL